MTASATLPRHDDTAALATELAASAVLIGDAVLHERGGGLHAVITLDRAIVRVRALEQKLADASVRAAATDPRVIAVIEDAIAAVNARGGSPIVGYTLR